MAIRINCPSCNASLSFDDGKGGSKVRCRKCEEAFTLPDQNDADADEERPAKKKKKKKAKSAKGGVPLPLLLAGGAAAFLILAVAGGIGVYFIFRKGPPPAEKTTPVALDPGSKNDAEPGKKVDHDPGKPALDGLPADVEARVKAATVHLSAKTANGKSLEGSGFVTVEPDLVITNAHVLGLLDPKAAEPATVEAVLYGGTPSEIKTPAAILGVDRANDLAVLRIAVPNPPAPLLLDDPNNLAVAQKVHVAGYPNGRSARKDVTINPTSIANLKKNAAGLMQEVQTNGGMSPGNSGGPVVNAAGHVVGVATGGVAGTPVHVAIPSATVKHFLDGRIGDPVLGHAFLENGQTKLPVQFALLDPLKRISTARVEVWTGPAGPPRPYSYTAPQPLPGDGQPAPQPLVNQSSLAKNDVVLPSSLPPGQVYWIRPVIVGAGNTTQWGVATVVTVPSGLLDRKPADLTISLTKQDKRTAKMTSTYSRSIPGKDKGVIAEKTAADLLEVVSPDTKGLQKVAKIKTAYGSLSVAIEKDGKKFAQPNEKQALDAMRTAPLAFLIDDTNLAAGDLKPVMPQKLPLRDTVEDWTGMMKNPFDAATLQMPNRTIKAMETFPSKSTMWLRTESKPIQIDLVLSCTYEGTRTRNERSEALITVTGQVKNGKGATGKLSGNVTGTIGFDLAGGFISYTQLKVLADTEQRTIAQDIEVDRLAGNPMNLQLAQEKTEPPPKVTPPAKSKALIDQTFALAPSDPADPLEPKTKKGQSHMKQHQVMLQAGKSYTITVSPTGFHAYVRVLAGNGAPMGTANGVKTSRVAFQCAVPGPYVVFVSTHNAMVGQYHLTVTESP